MWASLYVQENKNYMTQNLFIKVTIKYSSMHTKLQNNWCFFQKIPDIIFTDKIKQRYV